MNIRLINRQLKFAALAALAGLVGVTALQDTASAGSYKSPYKSTARINSFIHQLDPSGWSHKRTYRTYKNYRSIPSYRYKKVYRGHNLRHSGRQVRKNHTYSYTAPSYHKSYGHADDHFDYRGVDLQVHFKHGSSRITWRTRKQLDNLGYALTSPRLRTAVYRIAGHTDASGNHYTNQRLSERRARAVKRYLVHKFGINPRRLLTVGFGEERLIDSYQPYSPVNRRVEVTLIASHYADLPRGW